MTSLVAGMMKKVQKDGNNIEQNNCLFSFFSVVLNGA